MIPHDTLMCRPISDFGNHCSNEHVNNVYASDKHHYKTFVLFQKKKMLVKPAFCDAGTDLISNT